MFPKVIQDLISCYRKFPGIGEKNALRMALYTIKQDKEFLEFFSRSVLEVEKIKKCSRCNNLTDNEICPICASSSRDKKTICVVESLKNLVMIENSGIYNGTYYILDDLIRPMENVSSAISSIDKLSKLIKEEKTEELILAFKQNIEGETTSLYLKKILKDVDIKISKIAQGIPHGIDIDYIDNLTLERAMEERKEL